MRKPYRYHLRPAYGSVEVLLEFILDSSDSNFSKDLLETISNINPKVDAVEDLWMNDEVLLQVSSDIGSFLLSKDIWDIAFIMAQENQPAIKYIDAILMSSQLFTKEEVDFEEYHRPPN